MKSFASFLFFFILLLTSCRDSCDYLPQAYSKEEADFLPYAFDQKIILQDSVGDKDTLKVTYFAKYPIVENINDCTISTEYIECKITTTEPDTFASGLIISYDVKETGLLQVGNDMQLANYIPSVNATYQYGNQISILGKTFQDFISLRCVDNTCGPVLEVVFVRGKGLVALRNQQGWKVLSE